MTSVRRTHVRPLSLWFVCLLWAWGAHAQVPLEEHRALVLAGTRGAPAPVLDARAVLGGASAQTLLATRLAMDTLTIDATVGVQGRPWRGEQVAVRVAGALGPALAALDGPTVGGRALLEAQVELRLGHVVLSAGPRLDGALFLDGGARPRLGLLGTLAAGWLPPDSLGVVLTAEGGSSFSARGSGLSGGAFIGLVLPLQTAPPAPSSGADSRT